MKKDIDKIIDARNVIYKLANGINPLNNLSLENEELYNDPKIIRSLFFLVDFIDSELSKNNRPKKSTFIITEEQKNQVKLPEGNIGINEFAKAINDVIDDTISKKINGAMINNQLKKMRILSEIKTEDGKTRSITNETSEGYGIISQTRTFNNRTYEQLLFTDLGKEFLLENLESILSY